MVGIVQTAIGCGTVARARGIAVQAVAGDPIYQGDTVEVEAGGQVDIRLIDGTLLNLPAGSRLELGDLARNSSLRPGLFAKTRNLFRLIGSRLLGSGILTADTPVGTLRASGLGMLSFAALTVALLKDAQAAESNVTFLDDDNINYKDLHHGVFELVTKEAIPRHIIVDDPGETIILNKRGSSVSVSHLTNSATHMEELREAQQETLANFQKGAGSKGSGMPALDDQLILQPINFIQPGSPPIVQDPLAPLPGFAPQFVITFEPPPVPPKLNLGTAPIEIDTKIFDNFGSSSGTFAASGSGKLTFGIGGSVPTNIVLGQNTYDEASTGEFGTLYLNSATGAYTFIPNNDAINALKVSTIQSFVITVADGALSASESFNITIDGVDDASIISGAKAGSVVGAVGVSAASPGLLKATGLLTDTDVDDPANTFTAVSTPTTSTGGYGSFTLTTAGVWTYTLDNTNSSVQALKVGGALTDSFTVTTIGGTPQTVTIVVNGPLIGTKAAPSLTLSETHLTATALDDNIAGSAPDAALTTTSADFSTAFTTAQDLNGATVSYALTISGGNGTASGLIDSHTGLADVLVLNGNTIEGHVGSIGGTLAFTITVDPVTGLVTFVEHRAVEQPQGTSPDGGEGLSLGVGLVNLIATVTEQDGDFQSASIDLGKQLTITDDGPSIKANGTLPSLSLSETHLTATALDDNIAGSAPDAALMTKSADFSTAFSSVQGADGATIKYALAITGGNGTASGLIDSHTGLADILVLNGNTIEGHVGTANGTLAFTIALDPATGYVTFTDYRPVKQPLGTDPDSGEAVSLAAGIVSLTATITDKDGDFQNASVDLGKQLSITDDGPCIKPSYDVPSLTLSETHLTATALDDCVAGSMPDAALTTTSADFSTAFVSKQGADGATIGYALKITGGNCTASGLIDSETGCADVLVLNGNTIEGHVGSASGKLAFSIALDPATGYVTFTEYRAVEHPLCADSVALNAGVVDLVATITDKDGDFQSACIDLGKQLAITDDSPTIGGFTKVLVPDQDNQVATGTYDINFGADGNAGMFVAIHDGAVGDTGYNLATCHLGDGITSVQVTGNGDYFTFYYSTHEVGGGVELDAYHTDCNGTLTDPYFKLLIDPDGTFCFDLKSVDLVKGATVTGADFGASGSGTPSLTSADGQLVITGSNCGQPADVKASGNGIAVGDYGLQMDPAEQLNLAFSEKQSQVGLALTQWQGQGAASVTFKVLDGSADVHDFNICIPKPYGGGNADIVVQETSNASLINTYSFDNATSTYTLYVGKAFNQLQVDYDQAAGGNATFTVNNITYNEKTTFPSTDLLFDVSAFDKDGDSATTCLQVDIQCPAPGPAAPAFIFAAPLESAAMAGTSVVSDQVTHIQHDLIM
ncbi:DUF5801 repeats-in-toxin domain-containing protein [Bradyrhizobium mercantei]|uniref:DUF5801 repeats-in-toxin domain-containing protein n=1 Tax=Bradyrhizobium mercantei TaxID=1904807 RepID=UPI000976AD0E|nr:DUF5801 repeats-in-toxin domain-containing protein [Bradyrhizobium mercantei]